jgi:predicted HicB family RNase H-like nuclease
MLQAPERKRSGRKPLADGEGKTARVEMRVLPDTKAAWLAKAKAAGLTLQAWIEQRCNAKR